MQVMQVAFRRQWSPLWRRQVHRHDASAGRRTTAAVAAAADRSSFPSSAAAAAAATRSSPPDRRLSSGDGGATAASGAGGCSPKPRAGGEGWRRRGTAPRSSHRLNRDHPAARTTGPAAVDAPRSDRRLDGGRPPVAAPRRPPKPRAGGVGASSGEGWRRRQNDPEPAEMRARINGCATVDETIRLAHGYYLRNDLSPHVAVSFWRRVSSLMGKSSPNGGRDARSSAPGESTEQRRMMLDDLFRHTAEGMGGCTPADLSYLAQSAASIAKSVSGGGRRRRQGDDCQRALHDLLVRDSVQFWNGLRDLSSARVDACRPKWLVSFAWSFATVADPLARSGNAMDASPFFRALHRSFDLRRGEFTSKHMGNLAWSCVTCRHKIPALLDDLSAEFVRRRKQNSACRADCDDDGLDPMTLCQWANAYAKAGRRGDDNGEPFRSIAGAAVPLLPEFDARHMANLAHACATAGVVPAPEGGASSSLFDEIARAAVREASAFDPQNVANILWAYAKMEHDSPELFDALAREATPRLGEFSPQQLANLAWALSKRPPPPSCSGVVFDAIAREVESRGARTFASQGLAMLCHSFASVGHVECSDFWEELERETTERLRADTLGPIECSQVAWSFATIGRRADELFRSIESSVSSRMGEMRPQGLSNVAWAFATLGYCSPTFFDAVAGESLRRLEEFANQDKVMMVLACSRSGRPCTELFDRIASASASRLGEFTELDLFNVATSYAKAGHRNEPWMEAVADEIVRRPSGFTPQLMVGVAWAYSSLGLRAPSLFNSISDGCIDRCDDLESKEVASLAWSFSSADYFHRPLLAALADSSGRRWRDFDAPSLANMAWAYATAREDRPDLFEGIADAAVRRSGEFTAQGVSMLLWASAASGRSDRRLFDSLAPRAAELIREGDDQSLANIAWAYAVADFDADSLFGGTSHFVDVLAEKIHEFDRQGLGQLHQWNIWRRSMAADAVLPPALEKLCHDEFADRTIRNSKLQRDVMSELTLMGISPEEEFLTQSGYHLDALVRVDGENVGVEVDGPHHFVGRRPTGSTILKHKQILEVDGIRVVSLPYWELNDLESSEEKQRYLRAKLDLGGTNII